LDDITYGFLNNFSGGRPLSIHDLSVLLDTSPEPLISPVKALVNDKYIEVAYPALEDEPDEFALHTQFQITYSGSAALILHKQEKRRFHFAEFRAWCTLAIAFSALILSLINLFTNL
jgi:hypothetical protein